MVEHTQISPVSARLGQEMRAKSSHLGDSARVAKEFEAMLLSQAVDQMLDTVDIGSMGGGFAEETWRSFLAKAIADEISGTGATRISESVQSAIADYRAVDQGSRKTETGGPLNETVRRIPE